MFLAGGMMSRLRARNAVLVKCEFTSREVRKPRLREQLRLTTADACDASATIHEGKRRAMISKRLSMIAAINRRYNHINELAAHGNSVTVSRIWQAPTMHHIRSPGRAEQYGLAHRVRTRGAAVHRHPTNGICMLADANEGRWGTDGAVSLLPVSDRPLWSHP
jgi:hypothetical protein